MHQGVTSGNTGNSCLILAYGQAMLLMQAVQVESCGIQGGQRAVPGAHHLDAGVKGDPDTDTNQISLGLTFFPKPA